MPPALVLMYHCEDRVPISWSATGKTLTIHAHENDVVTRTVRTLVKWLVDTVATQGDGRNARKRKRNLEELHEGVSLHLAPGSQTGCGYEVITSVGQVVYSK